MLLPVFDNIKNLSNNKSNAVLKDEKYRDDFLHSLDFLKSYAGSLGTFNSYRREVERILQWSWFVKGCLLKELRRDDIENYLYFCQAPPKSWISLKKTPRFIEKDGLRRPNPNWRPFVVTVPKLQRSDPTFTPKIEDFKLSQGAVQEIFAILSTYFNFLIAEEYLFLNPVALIRQKSKFIRKAQYKTPVRRLSNVQCIILFETVEAMAAENPKLHERTKFIISILLGMYLRISELVASERWVPLMNNFAKDSSGFWWFTTIGKGNKERQVAVSNDVLESLKRWRSFLGLSPLPSPADNHPLLPKVRGFGPLSDTAPIRRTLQSCFNNAANNLRSKKLFEEADNLGAATVHWLRHTGISEDVKIRPREHVRDDAGHSSSATTDRYIDIELKERYESALNKTILPEDTRFDD